MFADRSLRRPSAGRLAPCRWLGVTLALLAVPLPAAAQVRISDMGPPLDPRYQGSWPAVAFNPSRGEHLVVWHGDDDAGGLLDNELEIFGQRLDFAGEPIGVDDFRISYAGGTGDLESAAAFPAVACNPDRDEYLVVWVEFDSLEWSLVGRRLDGLGTPLGPSFVIGEIDTDGVFFETSFSDVVYNPSRREYLVAWSGAGGEAEGIEIFVQRVDELGNEVGEDDRPISDMGPAGDDYSAFWPAVAFNAGNGEYLVVWAADDDTGSLAEGEFEIYGQRLEGDGSETGADDFRISDMGPGGDTQFDAIRPDVAYNPDLDQYLVVWSGDDDFGGLVEGESEIFVQRLNPVGTPLGLNDQRISDAGGVGVPGFIASDPAVVYLPARQEYVVVWSANDEGGGLDPSEREIYRQRLDGLGNELGANDQRVTFMGGTGDPLYTASFPALATGLVVWAGRDDVDMDPDDFEIFGLRFGAEPIFFDGFESGDTGAWDAVVP